MFPELYDLINVIRKDFLDIYIDNLAFQSIIDTAYQAKTPEDIYQVLLTGIQNLGKENAQLRQSLINTLV